MDNELEIDQSALTGESLSVTREKGVYKIRFTGMEDMDFLNFMR